MKTAGIPETTSVVGVSDGQVHTANTAAVVHGDNGNKYTHNSSSLNVTIIHVHSEKQKERKENASVERNTMSILRRVCSRVRPDTDGDQSSTTLQVEYTSSSKRTARNDVHNAVATQRETQAEYPTEGGLLCRNQVLDKDDYGIYFRDDHFSEPERLGIKTRSRFHRTISEDDDWVMVDDTEDGSTDTIQETRRDTETASKCKLRTDPYYSDSNDDDSLDISLQHYIKRCTDGEYVPFPKHVVPSDTGWLKDVSQKTQASPFSEMEKRTTQLLLEEEAGNHQHTECRLDKRLGPYCKESTLCGRNERRNCIFAIIVYGLQDIRNPIHRNSVKHLMQDVVNILLRDPFKVKELSLKLESVMCDRRHLNSSHASNEVKQADITAGDEIFAKILTNDLHTIEIANVRDEAEQMLESALCLGSNDIDALSEYASFVKDVKLCDENMK